MEHRPDQLTALTPRGGRGFTLIELLLVVAILVLVYSFAVPAVDTMMTGYRLGTGADIALGQIASARQSAIALNHTVEVRFYQYGVAGMPNENPSTPSTGKFRAVQLFEFNDSGRAVPISKVGQLPDGIIFDSGTLSTLMGSTQLKTQTPGPPPAYQYPFTTGTGLDPQVTLPECGTNYNCAAYQIYPGGNTSLGSTQWWYVTIHRMLDGDPASTLPHNYATIQVDANSGAVRLYRP